MYVVIGALFAVPAATGCDIIFATYCDTDADCAAAQVCGAENTCISGDPGVGDGGVVEDAGPGGDGGVVITITSVAGLGTETPISTPPGVDGGVFSSRRLADKLVVTGTGFDAVTTVELASDDGDTVELTIVDPRSDGEIEVLIPTQVSPGLLTLTLISTSLATSASAQVFVVQGEAAPPTVSVTVAADTAQCPNGGTVLTVGPDTDNDGQPNSGSEVIVCNGAPGDVGSLSCDATDCTLGANLNVTGTLAVDGAAALSGGLTAENGAEVLRTISTSETRPAATFAEIQNELADLRNYRIVPPAIVTIDLTGASYNVTSPIEFLHADAERIEIIGDIVTPTSVVLTCSTECFHAGLGAVPGFVNGVQFAGAGSGIGVDAFNGGSIRVGRNVDFFQLFIAIRAQRSGSVFVDSIFENGISIRDCETGILVNGTSTVEARNIDGTGLENGVIARQGHVDASFSTFAGQFTELGKGLSAESGGTIFAQSVAASGFEIGLSAQNSGMVLAINSRSDQNRVGASSILGSVVTVPGTLVSNNTIGIEARTQSIMQAEGYTTDGNGIEEGVDVDSLFIP